MKSRSQSPPTPRQALANVLQRNQPLLTKRHTHTFSRLGRNCSTTHSMSSPSSTARTAEPDRRDQSRRGATVVAEEEEEEEEEEESSSGDLLASRSPPSWPSSSSS